MASDRPKESPSPDLDLRDKARQRLSESTTDVSKWALSDIQVLLAELELHQEELRIQNENLQTAQVEERRSREEYKDLFERAPVGYLLLDRQGGIRGANQRSEALLGTNKAELERANFASFVAWNDQDAWFRFRWSLDPGKPRQVEELTVKPGDSTEPRTIRLEAISQPHNDPQDPLFRCALSDVTERAKAEQFNRTLLQSLGEGVFGIDAEGQFTFVNASALNLLGYEAEEGLLGENSHHLVHHTDANDQSYPQAECPIFRVMETGDPLQAWQDWFWRRDGSGFPVEVYATPLWDKNGGLFGSVVVFRDISEQKRLEAELERQATHDRLTGLYNRGFFDKLLDKAIRFSVRTNDPLALIMLDIDHFKAINDTQGHIIGDEILQDLAQTLRDRLRDSDTLARWGGEEFMILLPETDVSGAHSLAEMVRQRVVEQSFPGIEPLTISLGVTEYRPGEPFKDFTKRVDDALYAAKEGGRNRVVADTENRQA